MAGTLTVIWWRDIPAQIVAREGRRSNKLVLQPRFQTAIDRAAEQAGKKSFDDYIGEWRKVNRPCGTDLEAEVSAEAARLETTYTKSLLARLVASGGVSPDAGAATGPAG